MTNDAMSNWIEGLPTVPRDDPSVVNPEPIEIPATEHAEVAHRAMAGLGDPLGLGDMINDVHALNTEARAVFMFHSEAVRGQLLSNPKARNALDQYLWELAKDEELGNELRKQNPTRYEPLQSPRAQS